MPICKLLRLSGACVLMGVQPMRSQPTDGDSKASNQAQDADELGEVEFLARRAAASCPNGWYHSQTDRFNGQTLVFFDSRWFTADHLEAWEAEGFEFRGGTAPGDDARPMDATQQPDGWRFVFRYVHDDDTEARHG